MSNEMELNKAVAESLQDIRVELLDEFDRNFERKAFFSKGWQRRRGGYRSDKPLLIDTGNLRRSIAGESTDNSVVFTSNAPQAHIHNHGGDITVTYKMKAYFWHKFKKASGGFGHTKKGERRKDKRNVALSEEAQFYRAMALMKVGKKIRIPQRQFIGNSPEVEEAVREIVQENLQKFAVRLDFNIK